MSKAIAQKRDEVFLCTKIFGTRFPAPNSAGLTRLNLIRGVNDSLKRLQTDYIDLFLIHAPQPWADFRGGDYTDGNRAAWKPMEEALEASKVRAIGVSNFKNEDVDALVAGATVVPHVNQVLVHAGNTPQDILTYSAEKNIVVQGYSPMGHGEILGNETIGAMAEKYGVSVPQLAIRYVIQLGTVALPKTANKEHMKANADVNFEISDEDMQTLINLEAKDYGDVSFFPVYSGK